LAAFQFGILQSNFALRFARDRRFLARKRHAQSLQFVGRQRRGAALGRVQVDGKAPGRSG
jgi:hypothetical protein